MERGIILDIFRLLIRSDPISYCPPYSGLGDHYLNCVLWFEITLPKDSIRQRFRKQRITIDTEFIPPSSSCVRQWLCVIQYSKAKTFSICPFLHCSFWVSLLYFSPAVLCLRINSPLLLLALNYPNISFLAY